MKVIFLDHDGVICLQNNWGSRSRKRKKWTHKNPTNFNYPIEAKFDNFDGKAIKVLNSILEESGAEIVVSSDWKLHATLEEMGDYYLSQGIIKRPIAFTPNMQDFDPFSAGLYQWKNWYSRIRIVEIWRYLDQHQEITHWVAVDDLDMSEESNQGHGLSNFVLVPRSNEGIKQIGIREKILKHLK